MKCFKPYNGKSPTFIDVNASLMVPPGGPGTVVTYVMGADQYGMARMTNIDLTSTGGATVVSIYNADLPALRHNVSLSGNQIITNPQPGWILLRPFDTLRIAYQSADTSSFARVNYEIMTFNT